METSAKEKKIGKLSFHWKKSGTWETTGLMVRNDWTGWTGHWEQRCYIFVESIKMDFKALGTWMYRFVRVTLRIFFVALGKAFKMNLWVVARWQENCFVECNETLVIWIPIVRILQCILISERFLALKRRIFRHSWIMVLILNPSSVLVSNSSNTSRTQLNCSHFFFLARMYSFYLQKE